MGAVWRVRRDSDPPRSFFALKTLRFKKGPESAPYQRFRQEIQILSALQNHDGIVEVIEHSQLSAGEESELYYVMPWADTNLDRASRAIRGQLEVVLQIGARIARALEAAHEKGVIHRDIKPANILLYGDEREARLADFGIGYMVREDRLTRAEGQTLGTHEFVAPELRGGGQKDNVGPPVDVYSLGKTLYAAVSGGTVLPREWLDDDRYDLAKLLGDPRLEHLKGLLRRMITERPEDRYPSMRECREEIERAIVNLRNGTAYRPDMYGGRDTPVERFFRISKALDTLSDHRRGDAVQAAIRDAEASTRSIASEFDKPGGGLSGTAMQPVPAGVAAAERGAEELLAVGAALVLHNDLPGLDEWLAGLVQTIRTREDAATIGERWVLPPMASLAVHAVGALAWHKRRFEALSRIVDAQLLAPSRWIHHYVLGEKASAVVPWVTKALATSAVLLRADASFVPAIDSSVYMVAGLLVMRGVLATPDKELEAWADDKVLMGPTEVFPGFYSPALAYWAAQLPAAFTSRPNLERDVSKAVFGREAIALRADCAKTTKVMVRIVAMLGREIGQGVRWVPRIFGAAWTDWCGVVA